MYVSNADEIRKYTPQERKNILKNDIKSNIIPGIVCAVAGVGANAILKQNRGDTFTSTIKKCAKYEAKSSREHWSTLFGQFLHMKKVGNYISNISNKKMFAVSLIGNILMYTIICAALGDLFSDKK